jgi:tetratricopeptide (TPR) repeat protein
MLKTPFILLMLSHFLLIGCSGISMLQRGGGSNLYTEKFTTQIELIKELYGRGEVEEALAELQKMGEEELLPSERAMRRNLIGVILFSQERYEHAIYNFDLALTTSRLDRPLTAQIYLNLASSYYRLSMSERAYSALSQADFRVLHPTEAKKFHRLNFQLANELNRARTQLTSLIWYLSDKTSVAGLRDEPYYQELLDRYFNLERREQLRLINEFDRETFFVVGHLAYLTVERLYYQGHKSDADNLVRWIQRRYPEDSDVSILLAQFLFRAESFAQMNQYNIGIVLPLSGEKQGFGQRVLKGIDSRLQESVAQVDPESGTSRHPYQLLIRDSEGSAPVGGYRVRELVEQHNVSVIIGGLFSDEAKREYLEARRYGVLYISLSEVYLPKDQKDHLLIEIPGSVESQLAHLFSDSLLEKFGRRAAIVYPSTDRGETYVNEFWRRANQHGVKITGLASYDQGVSDFSGPLENLLGLKFKRQRQEELDLLSEVYALEGSRATRRVQILKPQIDFDWVFVAAFPREGQQLIPYFSYYDAVGLNIIGGPSWRSEALARESQRLGTLTFIGDNLNQTRGEFSERFTRTYGTSPMLIELRGYDAFSIVDKLLSSKLYGTRDEFTLSLRETGRFNGLTGNWKLEDDVWLKEMGTYRIRRGRIESILSPGSTQPIQHPADMSEQELEEQV